MDNKKKTTNKGKKYEKPFSAYPMKLDEVVKRVLKVSVKKEKEKNKQS